MSISTTISLITDFGQDDEYVGVMKGVILKLNPAMNIIDICHTIEPQDIFSAARMLEAAYPYFPEGTLHLAVVDPGVGTARNILLLEADDHFFIAPDNGLLTPILQAPSLRECYRLKEVTDSAISKTFHGRDVIAPLAGKIASGTPVEKLCEKYDHKECVVLPAPLLKITAGEITGEVIGIDRFGNIATSIKKEHISRAGEYVEIDIGKVTISGIGQTYNDFKQLTFGALIDSRGNLEITMNMGNAAKKLGCTRGDVVVVRSVTGHCFC